MAGITTYREAEEQLRIAADALDQAHAMLRDLKLDDYITTGRGQRHQTVKSAYGIIEGLLDDLKTAACPDCGKPMADNTACIENRCPELLKEREPYCYECRSADCNCDPFAPLGRAA